MTANLGIAETALNKKIKHQDDKMNEMKEENSRPSNASKKGRSSSGSGKASAAAATKKKRSSTGSKSKEKTVEEKYQKKVCIFIILHCLLSILIQYQLIIIYIPSFLISY